MSTETWSITGGHRLRVSSDSIWPSVFASVSSRCTRFSDSASAGARGVEFGARIVVRGLGGDGGGFRFGQRRLRALDRLGERGMVAALERRQFALDLGDFAGDAGDALALLARGVLELVALGGEIGERGGQIGENLSRRR